MAAFPFFFERTITTKCDEPSPDRQTDPDPYYNAPAAPPPIPREQLPHIAIKEAITAAADKAKELAASATDAGELALVVSALKAIEDMALSKGRCFYVPD